ncbi:hypothetical protein ACMGD3_24025 [Lysinibacillus sphaericus]|uniref:hypothetical protein n=1 Tax=Lysinibacillus sphaericus TaxID=1421 RepID=UPI003F7A90E5
MAYQVPICDCGGKLLFVQMEHVEVHYRITNKGEKYKQEFDRVEQFGADTQAMICEDCRNRYPFDYDEKGRIVIAEKW